MHTHAQNLNNIASGNNLDQPSRHLHFLCVLLGRRLSLCIFGHWRITIHYARILAGTDRLKDKFSLQGPVWPHERVSAATEGRTLSYLKLSPSFLHVISKTGLKTLPNVVTVTSRVYTRSKRRNIVLIGSEKYSN